MTSAVILAGCGSSTMDNTTVNSSTSKQAVAIKFMLWNDSASERMYDELAQAFEAKNPGITIDFTKSDANTYSERLTVTLTGGGEVDAFAFKSLDEYYKNITSWPRRGARWQSMILRLLTTQSFPVFNPFLTI